MTTRDASVRVQEQARGTAIPEQPLILRVYTSDGVDLRQAERGFHALLNAADHTRSDSPASTGSREWFETSVEFLDTIAATLGLTTLQAEDAVEA